MYNFRHAIYILSFLCASLKPVLSWRILASTPTHQKRTAPYGGRITKQLTAEGLSGCKILCVDFGRKLRQVMIPFVSAYRFWGSCHFDYNCRFETVFFNSIDRKLFYFGQMPLASLRSNCFSTYYLCYINFAKWLPLIRVQIFARSEVYAILLLLYIPCLVILLHPNLLLSISFRYISTLFGTPPLSSSSSCSPRFAKFCPNL